MFTGLNVHSFGLSSRKKSYVFGIKKRYLEKYGLDPDEIPDYEGRNEMTPIEKEEVRNFVL
ncbi:hypothetical protein RCO48_08205 [Peribacillus frigoritolerans]|nr:hypothetical protein [Peribacillus frigoritolerans]